MKITLEEALAHRLRRSYLPLLTDIFGAWVSRMTVIGSTSLPESAAIGAIPGVVVPVAVFGCDALALVIAVRPREWKGHPELQTRPRSLGGRRWVRSSVLNGSPTACEAIIVTRTLRRSDRRREVPTSFCQASGHNARRSLRSQARYLFTRLPYYATVIR